MALPTTSAQQRALTLLELQRIKQWHLAHKDTRPLEYQVWDAVLTLWIMGWVGWLPAFALEVPLAYPFCVLGMATPQLYVRWRARAHDRCRLRCDWLEPAR
ncbi:hypothetical protein [Polaromonas sp.]|uniref:hypothetical protein n=1 Tax=Polaromonas sp. TaxID=1869339 RepID=UPI002488280B|nr:hypothetical protein [Polaromonas sp.]MDI1341407.1 hypothetical protein [Polaromonas sp.]